MEKIFSEIDLQQIVKRGNSLEKIMQQLHYFKNGIPTINLLKIASINDGIFQFSEQEIKEFCDYFDTHKDNYSIEKFVPASGAATRMFKSLNEFLTKFDPEKDTINSYVNLNKERDLSLFIVGLRSFPFYEELKEKTDRVEDAICATKAAIKEGIVPGGGIALLNASQNIVAKSAAEEVLLEAVRAPFKTILDNAGILEYELPKSKGRGLNVVTGNMVNMIKQGIIDPLLVTKSALRNAASVATTILSTDCVINNLRVQ